METPLINFAPVIQYFRQLDERHSRTVEFNVGMVYCQTCGQIVFETTEYKRIVQFLKEDVIFHVHYYYCRHCHQSATPPPPGTLPNVQVGLDVLCHVGYLHCKRGNSFSVIREHLQDCHGISRSETALQSDLGRLAIFVENTGDRFLVLLQEYYKTGFPKNVLLDEFFVHSFYENKLGISALLLPDVNFLLASNIRESVTNEVTKELLAKLKDISVTWDVVTTDLAQRYLTCVKEELAGAVIQFCVFHFFRLLSREFVQPLQRKIQAFFKVSRGQLLKEITELKSLPEMAVLESGDRELAENLLKRLKWCLKGRNPVRCVVEIQCLIDSMKKVIPPLEQAIRDPAAHAFHVLVSRCIFACESWLASFKKGIRFEDLLQLREHVEYLKNLFREASLDEIKTGLNQLGKKCGDQEKPVFQRFGRCILKYQEKLTTYLQWGIQKTTSLIEKQFQEIRPCIKNGGGAKTQEGYKAFMNIFTLIKNTSPFRKRGEKQKEARSPVQRLAAACGESRPDEEVECKEAWYEWIPSMPVQSYKQKWKQSQKRKKKEWKEIVNRRKKQQENRTLSLEEQAEKRWSNSKTLEKIRQLFKDCLESGNSHEKPVQDTLKTESPLDIRLHALLCQFPGGLTRPEVVKITELPRSTVYDALTRLVGKGLIYRKKWKTRQRGRPKILFLVRGREPG